MRKTHRTSNHLAQVRAGAVVHLNDGRAAGGNLQQHHPEAVDIRLVAPQPQREHLRVEVALGGGRGVGGRGMSGHGVVAICSSTTPKL